MIIGTSTGTGFNFFATHRCWLKDCLNLGGKSGRFGALTVHCTDTVLDNFHVDGDGTEHLTYGVQIKGGYNNIVMNCSIRGLTDIVADSEIGFRDRGDAPWNPSTTTGTYPYSTGAWGVSDVQRQSHNTTFINCVVMDSPHLNTGFVSQESVGAKFINCYVEDIGSTAFAVTRISGNSGQEKDYLFRDCYSKNAGSLGFSVVGQVGNHITGVILDGCVSELSGIEGYRIDLSTDTQIINCTALNSSQTSANSDDGFDLLGTNIRCNLHNCRAVDDQSSKTQRRGIHIRSGNTSTQVFDCYVEGNSLSNLVNTGADSIIRRNIGFVTENSGTATITSGTSAVVVAHGLDVTPTLGDISVVMGENPTNSATLGLSSIPFRNIWVDTIGSTQFTINGNTDPGASNLDLAWQVIQVSGTTSPPA